MASETSEELRKLDEEMAAYFAQLLNENEALRNSLIAAVAATPAINDMAESIKSLTTGAVSSTAKLDSILAAQKGFPGLLAPTLANPVPADKLEGFDKRINDLVLAVGTIASSTPTDSAEVSGVRTNVLNTLARIEQNIKTNVKTPPIDPAPNIAQDLLDIKTAIGGLRAAIGSSSAPRNSELVITHKFGSGILPTSTSIEVKDDEVALLKAEVEEAKAEVETLRAAAAGAQQPRVWINRAIGGVAGALVMGLAWIAVSIFPVKLPVADKRPPATQISTAANNAANLSKGAGANFSALIKAIPAFPSELTAKDKLISACAPNFERCATFDATLKKNNVKQPLVELLLFKLDQDKRCAFPLATNVDETLQQHAKTIEIAMRSGDDFLSQVARCLLPQVKVDAAAAGAAHGEKTK